MRFVISTEWGRERAIRPQGIASSSRRFFSFFAQSSGRISTIDPANPFRPSGTFHTPAARFLLVFDRVKAGAIGDE